MLLLQDFFRFFLHSFIEKNPLFSFTDLIKCCLHHGLMAHGSCPWVRTVTYDQVLFLLLLLLLWLYFIGLRCSALSGFRSCFINKAFVWLEWVELDGSSHSKEPPSERDAHRTVMWSCKLHKLYLSAKKNRASLCEKKGLRLASAASFKQASGAQRAKMTWLPAA